MDDQIALKTEQTLPSKTEPSDDELALPLPGGETLHETHSGLTMVGEQSPTNEFIKSNGSSVHQQYTKDPIVLSQYHLPVLSSISEKSWDSSNPPILNTEIVVHGNHNDFNSTSADTIIDSDIESKPSTEEKEKLIENPNPEYEYIFCVAAIHKATPNNLKLLAISKIDSNIKIDVKSDGSSLNGYTADRSGSSTNSTICSQIEEPFLVPKVPQDSLMSLSSCSSSAGVLNQPKCKPNNILLSKNVYIYPENVVCQKCNYVYPGISDSLDSKDFKYEPSTNTCGKSKYKKKPKLSNINNVSSSKKTLKKKIQNNSENIFDDKVVKVEDIQNNDAQINSVENLINDPIKFDIGDKVLAYWVADKMFYPATIIDIVSPKYKVEFLSDYVIKSLNAEGLVHSTALKNGCPIAIFDTVSQEYRVGEIVSINEILNAEKTYTIDLDSEEVIVPFDKLVLDLEKAKQLQGKVVIKNYNRLSLSNVSEGKRIRLSRSTNTKSINTNVTNTKQQESSKRKKTKQETSGTNKKRKCLFPEGPDPRDIPSTSTGITRNDDYNISIGNISSDSSEFNHIREDLTTVNMNRLKNSDIDSEHSTPDKGSCEIKTPNSKPIQIFKDLHFILSYAKYKRMPMHDSDVDHDSEFSLQIDYFKPAKLVKKHLTRLINKYGGTTHRYLNLIPRSHYKFTYVVTDTPSQTCNFFLSLSLGIPSYHHKYIEQAVLQKLPFAEYLKKNNIQPLPNGWSIENKTLIFRTPSIDRSSIFSDYIIYLVLLDKPKREFFAGILRFCGAIVYTSWETGINKPVTQHTTVIVTDEHCPNNIAREKVPKLSVSWVIQGLICESARPTDGHESYLAINDISDTN